jgi:NADH-quinone oxidoreductase subunit J
MPSLIFWPLAILMLIGGVSVIAFRHPVASAMSVVACFIGLAGLFLGLSAFFVGVIQILVYTGAVMVLFIFIIMLLDLQHEKKRSASYLPAAAGVGLVCAFFIQLIGVLSRMPNKPLPLLDPSTLVAAAKGFPKHEKIALNLTQGALPDVHLIGHMLFTQYNLPLQILGVLLLVATIGVVVLSNKQTS